MPAFTFPVKKHKRENRWFVELNNLIGNESNDWLSFVVIRKAQNERGESEISSQALMMHKSLYESTTRETSSDELPDDVQRAIVQVSTIATKMRNGWIRKDGRAIATKDIPVYAAEVRDGGDLPFNGFEEINNLGNAFGELRL